MVDLVPLRQRHFYEAAKQTSPWPYAGLAAVEDGRTLGLGGLVTRDGETMAFLHVSEGVRRPVTLMRAARRVLGSARAMGLRVVAGCDPDIPRSAEFLKRLGFRPIDELVHGMPGWALED